MGSSNSKKGADGGAFKPTLHQARFRETSEISGNDTIRTGSVSHLADRLADCDIGEKPRLISGQRINEVNGDRKYQSYPQIEHRNPVVVNIKEGLRSKLALNLPDENFLLFFTPLQTAEIQAGTPTVASPLRSPKSWTIVKSTLDVFSKLTTYNVQRSDWVISRAFIDALRNYQPHDILKSYNFLMLDSRDLRPQLVSTLPIIVKFAQRIDVLLMRDPIPVLKCLGDNTEMSLFLTRELCCSLLANAFFCTFPENQSKQMSDFNFFRLFNDTECERCGVKVEKIKCLLNYFNQMEVQSGNATFLKQIISFQRRKMARSLNWESVDLPLCPVKVEGHRKIEEEGHMLQADFANKFIGGGVLNNGCVMEEIRFLISPELLVSKLFSPVMEDNEVVTISGTEIFSKYSGYSTSFRFEGSAAINLSETDKLGRTETQVVAMDATYFTRLNIKSQFEKKLLDRELLKANVAFMKENGDSRPIATGNWGCGAFNGDPGLKFIIQWMAASNQGRIMAYHTIGNRQQSESIERCSRLLLEKKVSVGELYKTLIQNRKALAESDDVLKFICEKYQS